MQILQCTDSSTEFHFILCSGACVPTGTVDLDLHWHYQKIRFHSFAYSHRPLLYDADIYYPYLYPYNYNMINHIYDIVA